MQFVYLGLIFAIIMTIMAFKRPFYEAVAGGLVASILFYRIPLSEVAIRSAAIVTKPDNLKVMLALYFVTYLQYMLEKRNLIELSVKDMDGVFKNRRLNASLAPTAIGMLPSSASSYICGNIVNSQTAGYLNDDIRAAMTSWFKHTPESFLPTYTNTILFCSLSGIAISTLTTAALPMGVASIAIMYFMYLVKIPKTPLSEPEKGRLESLKDLFSHLWPIIATVAIILAFDLHVAVAIPIIIVCVAIVFKFTAEELIGLITGAFQIKLIANTALTLILKEFVDYAGVLDQLPEIITGLPIPAVVSFCIIYAIGGLTGFATGMITLVTPLAFATLPGAGVGTLILFSAVNHAFSLISPVHTCLVFAADACHSTMGGLLKYTLIPNILYMASAIALYVVLDVL